MLSTPISSNDDRIERLFKKVRLCGEDIPFVLTKRSFLQAFEGWLIDETLFKDFGCADRSSGRRGLRATPIPIVLAVSIPSTCPLEKIGLA
jgi:hypothetical protein